MGLRRPQGFEAGGKPRLPRLRTALAPARQHHAAAGGRRQQHRDKQDRPSREHRHNGGVHARRSATPARTDTPHPGQARQGHGDRGHQRTACLDVAGASAKARPQRANRDQGPQGYGGGDKQGNGGVGGSTASGLGSRLRRKNRSKGRGEQRARREFTLREGLALPGRQCYSSVSEISRAGSREMVRGNAGALSGAEAPPLLRTRAGASMTAATLELKGTAT